MYFEMDPTRRRCSESTALLAADNHIFFPSNIAFRKQSLFVLATLRSILSPGDLKGVAEIAIELGQVIGSLVLSFESGCRRHRQVGAKHSSLRFHGILL
jgi:hypothetical protein